MIPRELVYRRLNALLLAGACCVGAGHAQAQGLTLDIPACKPGPAKALPDKYYALAKQHKDFVWAPKTLREAATAGGAGWERVDGSGMHNWFAFRRIDINNDGYCDWYLDASVPLSTGGDRDSINTIYLGRPGGWSRIGASIPDNKPDQLGSGKAEAEQLNYLFGEEPGVIHDAGQKINYVITALYSRHARRSDLPGYRILTWDAAGKTLRALDKWQPGSKAAAVYAYFKRNGAYVAPVSGETPEEARLSFDIDQEKSELNQACDANAEQAATLSPHLRAACKRVRTR